MAGSSSADCRRRANREAIELGDVLADDEHAGERRMR
jgi:hypothetical protein